MAQANIKAVITAEDRASRVLGNFAHGVDNLGSRIGLIAKRAGLALAGATAGATVFGIKTAASLESSRQGFVTLLGSAEKADKTMARIKKEAARTPFEIAGLTTATQMLAGITKDGDRAIDFVLNVGEGLAAMGRGQAELDRISVNLQQIAATGRAYGIDIKQFAFAGIPIFQMLQKETGKSGEALDKFIEDGGVTFELLEKMFDKANDKGGEFFDAYKNQSNTLNQLWSNLKDTFSITMSDILTKSGIYDKIKDKVKDLSKWINDNREAIIKFIKDGIDLLKKAFDELKPFLEIAWGLLKGIVGYIKDNTWVIKVFAGAFIILKTAMIFGQTVAAFSAAMAIVRGQALLTAGTQGIGGMTKALQGFRILAASPITLPALAIGAALVSIALVYKSWRDTKKAIENSMDAMKAQVKSDIDTAQKLLQQYDLARGDPKRRQQILNTAKQLNLNLSSGMVTGLAHYASGTDFHPGGMAVVGEKGPELVNLPRGSSVTPNNKATTNINLNVNIGLYAGSEMEKRKVAKALMDAYQEAMGPGFRMAT